MVSEPTLAVSRHIRAEVRGHEHGRVGAQMPPACGRARARHGHRTGTTHVTWPREEILVFRLVWYSTRTSSPKGDDCNSHGNSVGLGTVAGEVTVARIL